MIKRICLILFLFLIFLNKSFSSINVYILATVDNEIITNYDIKKEIDYLKILNPNLEQLSENEIEIIAKNSLIKEIIKKNEVVKVIDVNKKNPFVEDYLKNFYSKLNINNKDEFEKNLKEKNNYTLEEIKEKIKIELLWNELIFLKYGNQVKINKEKLSKKIENLNSETQKEYMLSEIVFEKQKDKSLKNFFNEINLSIKEIGFNNSANIYSISESSKIGGKIGWVNENSLSELLIDNLKSLKVGEHTGLIKLGNNYLILKIDEIKYNAVRIDKKKELEKMVKFETNKQLNQFSRIFFNRSKMNYAINEN